MEVLIEAIQNILGEISEPLSDLLPIFPGTIITVMLITIFARKKIFNLYQKLKINS
jgi:hypothetical protein